MNKKLALVEETEIAEIKRKHESIFNATRILLAAAIEVGEWFEVQHKKIEHGDWLPWLSKNFPEITARTIQRYVLLARNKELLETKFQIRHESFLEWPSIRTALREIEASKDKPKDPEPEQEADDDVSFPFDKDGEPAEKPANKPKPKPVETGGKVLTLSSTLDELNGHWGPEKGLDNIYTVQVGEWLYTVKRVPALVDAKAETGRAVREREARNDAASR
jgi:hypothetical protein